MVKPPRATRLHRVLTVLVRIPVLGILIALILAPFGPLTRRAFYGRKIFECSCGAQHATVDEYETHWKRQHAHEPSEAFAQQPDGTWAPAMPMPGYFRERAQADW